LNSRKNILFLTVSNLPTNPRLLKEIDLISKTHIITVVLWKLRNWSDKINKQLIQDRPHINFITLDASRNKLLQWFIWALIEKISRIIYPLSKSSLLINSLAHTRRSIQILNTIKNIKEIDGIIAHNLGALFPAYYISKKRQIPFIYDIEDYDAGIKVPQGGKYYKKYTEFLLKRCAQSANALTSASTLIGKYTLDLIGGHTNHHVILNSFPTSEFFEPKTNSEKSTIRFVWFSQTISFGRGLEQLFESFCLPNFNPNIKVHLTIIGNLDEDFNRKIIKPFQSRLTKIITLNISPPLPQNKLHKELSKYDIGLALEIGKDLNNKLAVSNKIIAYTQAGLYVLATNTMAQRHFIKDHPNIGIVSSSSPHDLSLIIKKIISNNTKIKANQLNRYKAAHKLSWENEATKLINIWNSTF